MFAVDAQDGPTTTWQTEEEKPCLYNTCLWAAKRLNAALAYHWTPSLPKYPRQDVLQWDTTEEVLPTCQELWDAKEPPSNIVALE